MSVRPWDFGWQQIICDQCKISLWTNGKGRPPGWVTRMEYDICDECAKRDR